MKLTRDELMEIFAKVSAEEVRKYSDAMNITPIEEFGLVVLVGTILDRVEEKIFK